MMPTRPVLDSDRLRQFAVLGAVVGGIVMNTLSNIFPIGGLNVGQLSNQLFGDVQIIPASYAFAIWGLIYLGLLGFGLYQLQPSRQHTPILRRIGWLLIMASIAQVGWIYLFQARLFALSILPMLGILLPLIGIYRTLKMGQQPVSRQEQWLVYYPMSLYLGWITVATVVNGAIGLYSLNWDGWGIAAQVWAATMVAVSGAIALTIARRHRDPIFPMVVVWALVAIALRHRDVPLIVTTAVVMAIIITGVVIFQRLKP